RSTGSIARVAPAAIALVVSSSTSSRLPHEKATMLSVWDCLSQICRSVKVLKNGSVRSMACVQSFTIMQAAWPSVKRGSNAKPSWRKNSIDRFKSRTDKLMKTGVRECSARQIEEEAGIGPFLQARKARRHDRDRTQQFPGPENRGKVHRVSEMCQFA